MIYSDVSLTIGKTPLIKVNTIVKGYANNFFIKTESRNPAGSVKCRIAYSMIDDSQKQGKLKKGMTIVEPTSGNTGIGLSAIGKACGYDVIIIMPDSMSIERRELIKGFGAELILTPSSEGMSGAVKKAVDLVRSEPDKYFMPNQFENPANPAIHMITTAPEIDNDLDGHVDVVVAGVGTGGTVTGIGSYFRDIKKMPITIVAVEPSESPVISQYLAGEKLIPSKHKIQGIGAGFIPKILDVSVISHVVTVDSYSAIDFAKQLMSKEGVLSGISGGAALCGAIKISQELKWNNKNIVVIIPDSGERYLSTDLYSNI